MKLQNKNIASWPKVEKILSDVMEARWADSNKHLH